MNTKRLMELIGKDGYLTPEQRRNEMPNENDIRRIKARMREAGIQLEDPKLHSQRTFPELAPAQEKTRQKMLPLIKKYSEFLRYRYGIDPEFYEDIKAYVELESHFAAARYRQKKNAKLTTFMVPTVRGWIRNCIREKISQEMAIGKTQAGWLMGLIKGISSGQTLRQAAEQRRIPYAKAMELMEIIKIIKILCHSTHCQTISWTIL